MRLGALFRKHDVAPHPSHGIMDVSHILTEEQRQYGLTLTMVSDDFLELRIGTKVLGVFNESTADTQSIRSFADSILCKPGRDWLYLRIWKLLRR